MRVLVLSLLVVMVLRVKAQDGTYQLNSNGVQLIQGLTPSSELLQKHAQYSQQALRATPYTRDQTRNYAYAYGVDASSTGDRKAAREERQGNTVVGQYQVVEPDGAMRVVDYSVMPGTGFQASVNTHGPQQYSRSGSTASFVQKTQGHHFGDQKFRTQQFQQHSFQSQQKFQQDLFQNQEQFQTHKQQNQFQTQQYRQAQIRSQSNQAQIQSQSNQDQFEKPSRFQNQHFSQGQFQGQGHFQSQQYNNQETSRQEINTNQFQRQDQQRAFHNQQQQQQQRVYQGRQFEDNNQRAQLYTSVPGSSVILKTTFGDSDRDGSFIFEQQHQLDSMYRDHQLNQRLQQQRHSSAFHQKDQNQWNPHHSPVSVVLA
ncbi:hypothetical protein Pmani_001643 [Petrolisthes manimaculis]|uniref:Uncharacterized protein n=1 Tax=Petrolisthes manimaculis TaxID=1843537 RepID=A0AAE1QK57_9EUCA|nr:hypothetical protein Pmani_001643 [Petrolisthes manimaculis]